MATGYYDDTEYVIRAYRGPERDNDLENRVWDQIDKVHEYPQALSIPSGAGEWVFWLTAYHEFGTYIFELIYVDRQEDPGDTVYILITGINS